MLARFVRFNLVSALGVGVQLLSLWFCMSAFGLGVLPATGLAVGAAVLHNFCWHLGWTWADRIPDGDGVAGAFVRFALANGVVSLTGNLVLMELLVHAAGVRPLVANLISIAACGMANFWLGDRLVFRGAPPGLFRNVMG